MINAPPNVVPAVSGVASGPLAGTRVIDLGRALAAPLAGSLLADLGADVVRVELPVGDPLRRTPALFRVANRNKRFAALDHHHRHGRDVLARVCSAADVVLTSERADGSLGGEFQRALHDASPNLIVANLIGFPSDSPEANRPAIDFTMQAETGLFSAAGSSDGALRNSPFFLVDCVSALSLALGVVSWLADPRRVSGTGRCVETSMADAGHLLSALTLPNTGDQAPDTDGIPAGVPGAAPCETFACADGTGLAIAAHHDHMFDRLCAALGLPRLVTDERFASAPARSAHRRELHNLLTRSIRTHDSSDLQRRLDEAAVPYGLVRAANERPGPSLNTRPGRFDAQREFLRCPLDPRSVAEATPAVELPPIGRDTEEVLDSFGFTSPELEALEKTGAAVFWSFPGTPR